MRTSAMARLGVMAVLMMGLMVPLAMMYSVVSERATRRASAATEISSTWGEAQTVGGVVLVIPYRHSWTDSYGRIQSATVNACFLPQVLTVTGSIEPEVRRRSLFPVIVYRAHLRINGRFARPDFSSLRPSPEEIRWDEAMLNVGVSDPKGIARRIDLVWNGRKEAFTPGVTEAGLFTSGAQAPARGIDPASATAPAFELEMDLNGTGALWFLPAGDETSVQLTSSWQHPGFFGAPLPASRRIDVTGFSAAWHAPYFGRGYTSRWTTAALDRDKLKALADASSFGVTLVQPVDIYQQAERAVKYAALFIVMTFVIAFVWEIMSGVLVHPIQYLFVGFAMCIFYLLLLSLSEHIGFDPAYAAAAAVTIALLAWYWSWVLRGARQGAVVGAALTGLYGYLYLLLRLEDFALLAGSIGLFVMLAAVMFLTRRVNWYDLRLGANS